MGPSAPTTRSTIGKPWQVSGTRTVTWPLTDLGICKYHTTFLGATLPNFEDWSKVLYYNTGLEMTPEGYLGCGRKGATWWRGSST